MSQTAALEALAGEWNKVHAEAAEPLRPEWWLDVATVADGLLRESGVYYQAVATNSFGNSDLARNIWQMRMSTPHRVGHTVLNGRSPVQTEELAHRRTLLELDRVTRDHVLTRVVNRDIRHVYRATIGDVLLLEAPGPKAMDRFTKTARTLGLAVHTLFRAGELE